MRYSDSFVKYTNTLSGQDYEPLSQEREKELLAQYTAGDTKAFDVIIKAYLRFVIFLLKEYKIPDDVDIMDIVQEGNAGLIHGLHKFDSVKYSCRVSTYCVHWIRFFINKALSYYANIRNTTTALSEEEHESNYPRVDEKYPIDAIYDIKTFALEPLNDREKLVITYFYGLNESRKPKTLQEIASILHIHIERVRQLRDTAQNKINAHLLSQLVHNQ